jgi:hypothetical protein
MPHHRLTVGRTWMGLSAAALLALGAVSPAMAAQDEPQQNSGAVSAPERITQVIVYGDDPCVKGGENEIVVCVRRAERERYRIPQAMRGKTDDLRNESWLNRSKSVEYVGANGTNSCSPVGAGGFTGCFAKIAAEAKAEYKSRGGEWTRLVEEERARRLGNLDQESKQVEAQVKAEESARKAAEGQSATPAP